MQFEIQVEVCMQSVNIPKTTTDIVLKAEFNQVVISYLQIQVNFCVQSLHLSMSSTETCICFQGMYKQFYDQDL